LNNLSGFNNQYRYLPVCVDVYSRYAFVKPLKTKSAKNVANKFEQILIEEGEIPLKIQSDEGTEFTLIFLHYFIRTTEKQKRYTRNDLLKR
jgi:hypothetical protein